MKKVILVFSVVAMSLFASAQTKADSLAVVQAVQFGDSLVKTTSLAEFQNWAYSTLTAKDYQEKFAGLLNLFISMKLEEKRRRKQ